MLPPFKTTRWPKVRCASPKEKRDMTRRHRHLGQPRFLDNLAVTSSTISMLREQSHLLDKIPHNELQKVTQLATGLIVVGTFIT